MNRSILIIEDEKDLCDKYVKYAKDIFEEVFYATSLESASILLKKEIIDSIMSDNKLPDGTAINWIKSLRQSNPKIPIILITAYADLNTAITAVNLGLTFFLQKPASRTDIVDALKKCRTQIETEEQIENLKESFILYENTKEQLLTIQHLSSREIEVVEEVLKNQTNEGIANILNISIGTVKNHLYNIFQKTFVKNKDELRNFIKLINIKK